MEFIFSLFNFICNFIGNNIYEKSIINNLFCFDIKNKKIFLKPNKRINPQNFEEQIKDEIYIRKLTDIRINKNNRTKNSKYYKNNNEILSRNSENILIRANKIIKNYNKDKNIIADGTNEPNKINDNKSPINYDFSTDKKNKYNNEIFDVHKKKMIDKIDLKKLLMLKLFCCKKYKKNIYKILLDESLNIISEKLDIYNIFRMLFIIEENKNNCENIKNIIKMSKDGINQLSEIK